MSNKEKNGTPVVNEAVVEELLALVVPLQLRVGHLDCSTT